MRKILPVIISFVLLACNEAAHYDNIIRNGLVYDGNGGNPFKADIAVVGDTIAFIGDLKKATADQETDANGMVVAPGFINMLSWANESLIQDGRSESDIRQGVTLEVMGEGSSMGPLNDKMKREIIATQRRRVASFRVAAQPRRPVPSRTHPGNVGGLA